MPEDRDSKSNEAVLAVGGLLFVSAPASGRSVVRVGPAAGWMVPRGIAQWERELSFVARAAMTSGFASALRATRAEEQIAPKRFPMAHKAVELSPLLGLSGNLVEDARAQGVRVHTVGVDRVSGDFYYFEEGGGRDPLRVQGNLVEMLSPSIGSSSTNAEIAAGLDGLLDRLLLSLSGGAVSELAVELADALPRLSRDGTGLVGADLEAFEAQASAFAARAVRWEAAARGIPPALDEAGRKGLRAARVPLFGEAQREERPALDVIVAGKPLKLPGPLLWTVTGTPREEVKPAPSPAPARTAPSPTPGRVSPSPGSARVSPSPGPSRVTPASPSPGAVRPAPGPGAARTSPSPVPAKPSPSPAPARSSPTPGPSRVIVIGPETPAPVKPSPLRFTPIPPRPEPVVQPPASAPATPVLEQANDLRAPAPAAAVLEQAKDLRAPSPAAAVLEQANDSRAPAPGAASAPDSTPASVSAPEPSAAREAPAASSSASTVPPSRPRSRPPRALQKRSPSTLVLALVALAALAYVAFERFIH